MYPYFLTDKTGAAAPSILSEKYDALEHLFCELNEHYIFMSNFYFKINVADCHKTFHTMIDRIYELSPPADYTININGGGKKIKNKRKINKRKTNKRRTNKRKTNKRKTNKRNFKKI